MVFERIKLVRGDITQQAVDAIVNAANRTLLGGGGVDGVIHRAAGPNLYKECQTLGGCETGSAKITRGYRLAAKYVIHAVGPVWRGGNQNEEALLGNAYKTSLQIAKQYQCKTVAFPNISTGIYGFPKDKAAEIAIRTVQQFLEENTLPNRVYFVCFDPENYHIYQTKLAL